jgi:DNA modification methylase
MVMRITKITQYGEQMNYNIINGNNIDILKTFPDNYFDSIVTDPPYGINFLGKEWDNNVGTLETYTECLRVLKPGGHILAFSAARTYHHLAMVIEEAGFEIRDQIMWIYGSGFPKSQDVGKNNNMPKYKGWGTQLKPAHEPICMARKPLEGSVYKNVQKYGTGAINIDECRVPCEPRTTPVYSDDDKTDNTMFGLNNKIQHERVETTTGRFPANVIHDGSDEVTQHFPYSTSGARKPEHNIKGLEDGSQREIFGSDANSGKYNVQPFEYAEADEGSAARFFYCPKVNRSERHMGFDNVEPFNRPKTDTVSTGVQVLRKRDPQEFTGNNHPTVKPVELMKYLIKLVTPKNGKVLDPFNGSGSTGMAAVSLGHEYVGIELDTNYCEISKKRIEAYNDNGFNELFEVNK